MLFRRCECKGWIKARETKQEMEELLPLLKSIYKDTKIEIVMKWPWYSKEWETTCYIHGLPHKLHDLERLIISAELSKIKKESKK